MKTFLKPLLFISLLAVIISTFSKNKNHEEINLEFSEDFSVEKKNFLFADEEIKSLLTTSRTTLRNFPHISIEKIIEESIKFLENLELIENFQGEVENQSNKPDSYMCKSCVYTFNTLNFIVKEFYKSTSIINILQKICVKIVKFEKETCDIYLNGYSPVIVDSLIDSHFTGDRLCSNKYFCKNLHFEYLNPDDYAKKILADKPKFQPWRKSSNEKRMKILHLTDMHTDLDYTEGSNADCPNPVCCQKSDIVMKMKFLEDKNFKEKINNRTPTDYFFDKNIAGKWGDIGGKCDIPLRTTEHMFKFLYNNSSLIPDIIIWTGDNPSHNLVNLKNQNAVFNVTKTLTDQFNEITKSLNHNIAVYPSLGNHEKFPNDILNPYDEYSLKKIYKAYGDIWKDWLGEEAYKTFIEFGYYSKKHLNTNLKIVSYNCLYCDGMNFFLLKNPTNPQKQFDWLESELRNAENNNEFVYLITHIPLVDHFFLKQCAKRLQALLDRFSYIIRGHFTGHTHNDHVNIHSEYFADDKGNRNITGAVFTAPSLTTFDGLNPSFRLFEADAESKLLLNYMQYGFNVTEANLFEDSEPNWKIRYNANEYFELENLFDYQGIKNMLDNLDKRDNKYDQYLAHYFSEGTNYFKYRDDEKKKGGYLCKFKSQTFEDYQSCAGKLNLLKLEEKFLSFIMKIEGDWYRYYKD